MQIGDIVWLKSGGPAMTIFYFHPDSNTAKCGYFFDGLFLTMDVDVEALTKTKPKEESET